MDVFPQLLDLLIFLSLVFLGVVHILVALTHVLLQLSYFVHLVVSHPQGCSVVSRLVEDLRNQLLALFN
jgi:hypothetical protein